MSTCECKVCISWAAKTPRGRSRDRQNFFGGFSFVLKLGNSQRADPAAGNSSTDTDVQHCSKTNISESHTSSICFAFQGVSVPHTSVLRDQESKLDQQRLIKEGEKKKEKKKKKMKRKSLFSHHFNDLTLLMDQWMPVPSHVLILSHRNNSSQTV